MKCAICGDDWEYSDEEYDLDPFKICLNCRLIGPDKPGKYLIPKESDLPLPYMTEIFRSYLTKKYLEYFKSILIK